jgi:hypothetical protein
MRVNLAELHGGVRATKAVTTILIVRTSHSAQVDAARTRSTGPGGARSAAARAP